MSKRFWSKVVRNGPDECWGWSGSTVWNGYGCITINGKYWRAHRYSWFFHNGPIPHRKVVMHTCDTRSCTNPRHLKIGTQADNLHDRDRKGRQLRGETHNMVILTEDQVREIWLAPPSISHRVLAKRYPVSEHGIGAIRRGKTWRHVTSQLPPPSKGE